MPSEAEAVTAFVFKRSGRKKMKTSDVYLTLSMDLKWFPPNQAKEFINNAIKQKMMKKEGEYIKPNFDYKKIAIPFNFQPSKKAVIKKEEKEKKTDVTKKIINRVVKKTDVSGAEVNKKIKKVGKERNITLEVAALLVGKEHKVSLEDCFEETESSIFRESKG